LLILEAWHMRTLARYALSIGAAAALLSGCGGSQPSVSAPGAMPQNRASATHAGHGGSWMLPEAKSEDLLYISSYTNSTVKTYDWPNIKREQILRGFTNQNGLCVDGKGEVFVANTNAKNILKYAHGGSKPIATLMDLSGYSPASCAIDPLTGNLAVTNFPYGRYGSRTGNVVIFHHASGKPKAHVISNIYYYYLCGYDNRGDLVVDGSSGSGIVSFAILPHDKNALQSLTLDESFKYPGGIQWDGRHWAIGDQGATIYQFDIAGTKGTKVSSTTLNESDAVYEFFISGDRVIAPEYASDQAQIFKYPAGGNAITSIHGLHQPFGAVISP
jgi:hypothetical protein